MSSNVFTSLAAAARSGERVALGVITSIKGSSPQKAGALAVFHAGGRIDGTLGGGCLEAEAQKLALAALESAEPRSFDVVLDRDFRWDDAMICGGRVTGWLIPDAQRAGAEFWEALAAPATTQRWGIDADFAFVCGDESRANDDSLRHFAVVAPPVELWIAGAGHIAQAVAPLALAVDFAVTVLDDRAALASRDFFPAAANLHADEWPRLLAASPAARTFGLIVTRGHEHDALALRAWLPRDFAWLGMIGSKRKARLMRETFVSEGVATEEQMAAVECPVGLEIGAQSPQEIAVSIVARLIERRAAIH
jgi:xanthine dehydrogenase accessory factor